MKLTAAQRAFLEAVRDGKAKRSGRPPYLSYANGGTVSKAVIGIVVDQLRLAGIDHDAGDAFFRPYRLTDDGKAVLNA